MNGQKSAANGVLANRSRGSLANGGSSKARVTKKGVSPTPGFMEMTKSYKNRLMFA